MAAITSTQLAQIQESVYTRFESMVMRINKKRRPVLAWLLSMREETDFTGGSITVNNTIESNLQETTWVGDDEIEASEPDFILPLSFGYFNFNVAIKILHDQLKRLGYTILPNGSGKLESRAMSKNDALKLVKYLKQLIFEASDAYDRRLDLLLLRTGAQSTTVQPGIMGIISQSNNTGNIGGKARASYPSLQHQVQTSLTLTSGGTFRDKNDKLIRAANLYSGDGGVPGEIDRIFAGSAWIDGYKAWNDANNFHVQTVTTEMKKLDRSIPDDALQWNNIVIMHNPTMETLDALETFSPTLTNTGLFLNSQTWKFYSEPGLHKYASSPMDPPKQRLTRQDLDGTYSLTCRAPASNGYSSL